MLQERIRPDMTLRRRNVTVKQLPQKVDRNSERTIARALAMAMTVERPAIVLDCSGLREMDCTAIYLLLSCLEEAMKRNGDVRLAAVSPQASEHLRAMGVHRLFRIFDTNEQAIESFQRRAAFVAPHAAGRAASENAA